MSHDPTQRRDRGRVAVFVAGVMPMILAFLALTWDASDYLRTLHRTDNIAHEAARAAGQAIDIPLAVTGENIVVDPAAAQTAGYDYLANAGVACGAADVTCAVAISADRREVTVTVTVTHDPLFLGEFGIGNRPATGQAVAHLVDQ